MRRWSSRYAHVPLAVLSLVVLVTVIAWLLVHRLDLWRSVTAPLPPVVAVPSGPPLPEDLAGPAGSAGPPGAQPGPPRSPRGAERYALESGPFGSAEAADRVEDELNRLGHVTVRFRKHDQSRRYVVAAVGFASRDEAEQAARRLGRGSPVEMDGTVELLLDRLPSLGEAVAASRALRAQGVDVRVRETLAPGAIYFVRYGDFARRSDADTRSRELARLGLSGRVVRIRGVPAVTPRTVGSGVPPAAAP